MSGKTDRAAPEIPVYRDRNLQIVFAITLMAVLGVSSVSPVFPQIIREFGITAPEVGLLITFFTLPGVFLAPVMGILADRLGRKRVLVPSLFLFAVAGTACAFARDFNLLLGLRALQGIGGASLGYMNTTLVGDLFSGERRAEAMGLNASLIGIGATVYPAIGGGLAVLGWYYPFLLAALALPVGILVLVRLQSPEPEKQQGMKEYLSGTLSRLRSIRVIGFFLAGLATIIVLYGAYLAYFSLLLDESYQAPSFTIGILLAIAPLSTAVVSSQLGRINRRLSLGKIIKLTFFIYAAALALIPLVPNLWLMPLPLVIFGIAHGANIPSLHTAVAGLAPLEYRAAFMSLNAMILRLGQTLGPPLMAVFYVYWGIEAVFYGAAAMAVAVPVVAVLYSQLHSQAGQAAGK